MHQMRRFLPTAPLALSQSRTIPSLSHCHACVHSRFLYHHERPKRIVYTKQTVRSSPYSLRTGVRYTFDDEKPLLGYNDDSDVKLLGASQLELDEEQNSTIYEWFYDLKPLANAPHDNGSFLSILEPHVAHHDQPVSPRQNSPPIARTVMPPPNRREAVHLH